jgi:hypothetical protein
MERRQERWNMLCKWGFQQESYQRKSEVAGIKEVTSDFIQNYCSRGKETSGKNWAQL